MLIMLGWGTTAMVGGAVVVAVVISTHRSNSVVRSPTAVIVSGGLVIPHAICVHVSAT